MSLSGRKRREKEEDSCRSLQSIDRRRSEPENEAGWEERQIRWSARLWYFGIAVRVFHFRLFCSSFICLHEQEWAPLRPRELPRLPFRALVEQEYGPSCNYLDWWANEAQVGPSPPAQARSSANTIVYFFFAPTFSIVNSFAPWKCYVLLIYALHLCTLLFWSEHPKEFLQSACSSIFREYIHILFWCLRGRKKESQVIY